MGTIVGTGAPHNLISWDSPGLTTNFKYYRVYRAKAGAKPGPDVRIAQFDETANIGADMSVTNAESYRVQFRDYEASQAPGEFNYYVSVVRDDGAESPKWGVESRNQIAASDRWWLVSNRWPELNVAFDAVFGGGGAWQDDVTVFNPAGRDGLLTSTPLKRPGQTLSLQVKSWGSQIMHGAGQGLLEHIRANLRHPTKRPQQWCLVSKFGERWFGTPTLTSTGFNEAGVVSEFAIDFVETGYDSTVDMPYQGPAQLRLDGSTGRVDFGIQTFSEFTPAQSFTILWFGILRSSVSTASLAGIMGNWIGAGGGWYLSNDVNDPNHVRLVIDDDTAITTVTGTSEPWDDALHVVGARRSVSDDAITIWVDGINENSSTDTTTGPIGIPSQALALGTIGGSSNEGPTNSVAATIYSRALTDNEMSQAPNALHGYPGWTLPAEAGLNVDFRDSDCYSGSGTNVADLSGNGRDGTITGTTVWLPRGA